MALLSGWVSRWLQGEVWRERSMSADVQDSRGVRGPPKPSSQEETSAGSTWQRGPILGSRPQPTLLRGGGRPRPTHQRLQVHQVCHRSLLLHGRCKIRQGCRLQSTSKGRVDYITNQMNKCVTLMSYCNDKHNTACSSHKRAANRKQLTRPSFLVKWVKTEAC